MIGLLIAVGYLTGALLGWRIGYVVGYEKGRKTWRSLGHESAHTDGLFFGTVCAIFWPVALAVAGFLKVATRITPVPPTRREDLLREREQEVARLERELGLDGYDGRPERRWY